MRGRGVGRGHGAVRGHGRGHGAVRTQGGDTGARLMTRDTGARLMTRDSGPARTFKCCDDWDVCRGQGTRSVVSTQCDNTWLLGPGDCHLLQHHDPGLEDKQ